MQAIDHRSAKQAQRIPTESPIEDALLAHIREIFKGQISCTVEQLAEALQRSPSSINIDINRGVFKSYQDGPQRRRILVTSVIDFLQKRISETKLPRETARSEQCTAGIKSRWAKPGSRKQRRIRLKAPAETAQQ